MGQTVLLGTSVAVVGMVVVFTGLILLVCLFMTLSAIVQRFEGRSRRAELVPAEHLLPSPVLAMVADGPPVRPAEFDARPDKPAKAAAHAAAESAFPFVSGADDEDGDEIAAVIAAVMAVIGDAAGQVNITGIRRVSAGRDNAWRNAGRSAQMRSF